MSNFINNLLNRHLDSSNIVVPRLPGRFEYATTSLFPVYDSELVNQKNEVPDSALEPDSGKNIPRMTTRISDKEGKIGKSRYILPQKPVNEPLVVIGIDETRDNNKLYRPTNEDKAGIDTNDEKLVRSNIKTPEISEKKITNKSKTSHAFKPKKDESEKNELSIPSASSLPETSNIKGNQGKFQKNQFDNLELSSREHPPELYSSAIKPKQSKIKYDQNADKLHNINTDFHNHHIVPVEKLEKTIEYKTTAESQPTIKVNIGRIEVRAVMEPVPTPPQRKVSLKPKLSLDDYLKQRDGGGR